ncbi:hypothetical protein NQ317_014552 [Molorchus minor]|uniref:Protein kintoun n=1 Tax=Molorchus minor TaxID=1323400 RepID=A0ABQ9JIX0_9CUCU|nr:hypothetical protein NQ317_014552 [Molorchus minor]
MEHTFDKLKELDLSRDEVERIGEALKKPEFRKLLTDYVEELQDPENKKIYEEEITQLEKERVKEGAKGLSWSLPHSLSPPRDDLDNKHVGCQVFDIVFHPDTLHLAEKNNAFRTMVNNTALEAVETILYENLLKLNHLSGHLKRRRCTIKYFNMPKATTRHRKNLRRHLKKRTLKTSQTTPPPKYAIKHRSHIDIQEFTDHKESKMNAAIPKELIVEINLPLLKSSSNITLDVTEKTVQLVSEKPAKYKLSLTLPYIVNEAAGNAKFVKDLKKLVIVLPVKRNTKLLLIDRNDSGVESDHLSPGSPDSDEEVFSHNQLVSEIKPVHKPSETPCEVHGKLLEKSIDFRTKFLDQSMQYILPEFTCHVFENIIAFTLNVKNVDQNSVGKLIDNAGSSIHVKFTSIGTSFYPSYYAFFVKLPSHKIDVENTTVEVWDNNVILQVSVQTSGKALESYLYGIHEENVTEKYVEEPEIIHQTFETENLNAGKLEEKTEEPSEEQPQIPEQPTSDSGSNSSNEDPNEDPPEKKQSRAIDICGTSYESSGDELSCSSYSPRKNKGILKRLSCKRFSIGRSISESSLDDMICSSLENCHTSLDSVIPEDGEVSASLKKTVRFNDVVTRQLFRSNSSILGQKKKNQRKAKNKKRAHDRRHSESEASENDDKKEGDLKDCKDNNEQRDITCDKKEDVDIFHLDIDN